MRFSKTQLGIAFKKMPGSAQELFVSDEFVDRFFEIVKKYNLESKRTLLKDEISYTQLALQSVANLRENLKAGLGLQDETIATLVQDINQQLLSPLQQIYRSDATSNLSKGEEQSKPAAPTLRSPGQHTAAKDTGPVSAENVPSTALPHQQKTLLDHVEHLKLKKITPEVPKPPQPPTAQPIAAVPAQPSRTPMGRIPPQFTPAKPTPAVPVTLNKPAPPTSALHTPNMPISPLSPPTPSSNPTLVDHVTAFQERKKKLGEERREKAQPPSNLPGTVEQRGENRGV